VRRQTPDPTEGHVCCMDFGSRVGMGDAQHECLMPTTPQAAVQASSASQVAAGCGCQILPAEQAGTTL
jgi:hypothetical protein